MKAVEFAEDGTGGLVVKLGQSNAKISQKVMKFDCEELSCFPEEEETLFFGGETELRIKGVIQWAKGLWRHYDKYMEPINAINRMINGRTLRDQSIWDNLKAQKWMNCIIRDYFHRQLSQSDETQIPKYVASLVFYQMSSTPHIRLNWDEMKSGYQWMSCILKSHDNQLDIAKLSVLFSDASSIAFVAPDGVDLEEEEWQVVVNGLSNVRKIGLSIKFRFELSSDEQRQNEMYMMAEGYLEMEESKWKCRRDGNVMVFTNSEDAESEKESEFFRQCMESMISGLDAAIDTIDESLEVKKQRKLAGEREKQQQTQNELEEMERKRQQMEAERQRLEAAKRALEHERAQQAHDEERERQQWEKRRKQIEKMKAMERADRQRRQKEKWGFMPDGGPDDEKEFDVEEEENEATKKSYKMFFSVNIQTDEDCDDAISDTKALRPLLADLFETKKERDVFEIKTRKKGHGFKIDFGIIIATAMHPADYIDTFDDLTQEGQFQEAIKEGFDLEDDPHVHIWEARYEKIDPKKRRVRNY